MNQLQYLVNKEDFIKRIYNDKCIGYTYTPSVLEPINRIIVLGDIHGDYNLLIHMLKLGNLIKVENNNIIWTGGDTYVVQVGDQIDRCRPVNGMKCDNPQTTYNDEASDIKIMNLCNNLHEQAVKVNGKFISLLGNHEIMNSLGNLSYVSYLGLEEFNNYKDPKDPDLKFKDNKEARIHAFKSGNEIGTMIGCSRMACVIIGKHLFVHAGLVDGLIEELGLTGINDIELINISIRMWLLGLLKKKYIKDIIKSSKTSMFWSRILGYIPPNTSLNDPVCMNHISRILDLFKIGNIIIGHTPQSFFYNNDINQTCDGTVWRVDNGSSNAFSKFDPELLSTGKQKYSRRPQILEIINDNMYYIIDDNGRREVLNKNQIK